MNNYLRNVDFLDHLGLTESDLKRLGAKHTAREIAQQPDVWLKTYQLVLKETKRIKKFFNNISPEAEVILTGAGSSAFIGSILEGPFAKFTGRCARAVATTDLLTHPEGYIRKN